MARTCSPITAPGGWFASACGAVVVTAALAMTVTSVQAAPTGAELRAAVIVAIMRFTSWQSAVPEAEDSFVRLCAVGEPRSLSSLLPASGVQKVGGHVLVVDQLEPKEVVTGQCNALVVGPRLGARDSLDILAHADTGSLLTICDGCRSDAAADTIIQLELHKQRVRFEVNLAKARATGVMLDAQLLELASLVRK